MIKMTPKTNISKIPKAITLIGTAITLTGLTFKLNQFMGAHTIFNLGVVILVVGLIWWAITLFK